MISAIVGALAILAGGTVVACSERITAPDLFSTVTPARELSTLGPLTAANAGAYHNAFLDFSFPRVKKAVGKGADHKQTCKVIAQAMREFVLAYRLDEDPRKIGDDIGGSPCRSADGKGATFSLSTDGTPSPEFEAVTNEMTYAVEIGLTPAELSPLFEQKVAYARANLDQAEADVIAAAASVGLSSVEYWSANYETQSEELRAAMGVEAYDRIPIHTTLVIPQNPLFSWRAAAGRVGLADLKGAIHGGISGARGGWQTALAGAVIEGGGRSASALLRELIQ